MFTSQPTVKEHLHTPSPADILTADIYNMILVKSEINMYINSRHVNCITGNISRCVFGSFWFERQIIFVTYKTYLVCIRRLFILQKIINRY